MWEMGETGWGRWGDDRSSCEGVDLSATDTGVDIDTIINR